MLSHMTLGALLGISLPFLDAVRLGLAYGLNFAELVVAAAMPCSAARVRF